MRTMTRFHIINGELYRTVTALMLHANAPHILGNVVGLSLFGFLSGMIAGSVYCVFINRTLSAGYQAGFIFLILGIITAAWMRAF